jgi:hypothetical protein
LKRAERERRRPSGAERSFASLLLLLSATIKEQNPPLYYTKKKQEIPVYDLSALHKSSPA